jgi:5-methylcytosine-specific restriction protein A
LALIDTLFIRDREYRRRAIHVQFGGNQQGGITPSSKFPFIFVFTGKSGDQHGYQDSWENENVFSYTGEGQIGDMQFTRGNLALRDHVKNGRRVFLFSQTRKAFVKYEDELVLMDSDYYQTFDTGGKQRLGIKFFFKRFGVQIPYDLRSIASILSEPGVQADNQPPTVTERSGLVLSRVGQGAYRKSVINRWENKCAVTGFGDSRILIASHIHPWRDAKSDERLDVHNGILLSPTYDALFDRHLISFENNGKIILSDLVASTEFAKVGVTGRESIARLNEDNFPYLAMHQRTFNEKQSA